MSPAWTILEQGSGDSWVELGHGGQGVDTAEQGVDGGQLEETRGARSGAGAGRLCSV